MARDKQLTIDELARKTGMTVRNIRAHQSRGLLAPPEVKGRTGFYGADHVARIELIKELQGDGLSLELIKRVVTDAGSTSAQVLRLTRAVREPFTTEQPQVVDLAELAERFQTSDPATVARAERMGLIRPLGEGRYEEVSPMLVKAGAELVELGIPIERALDVVSRLRKASESASKAFVRLFIEEFWEPRMDAGGDDAEAALAEVTDAVERLRPLASQALLAIFGVVMDEEVERTFGRELVRRSAKPGERNGPKGRKRAAKRR